MSPLLVIILSDHSLFAEGTASRLRQSPDQFEIAVMDPSDPEIMRKIKDRMPAAIILEPTQAEPANQIHLSTLFRAVPNLKVIRLDPQSNHLQVVTSQQRYVGSVAELLEVIKAPS